MSGFPQSGPVFPASYPGECPECGGDFIQGDRVRYVQAHDEGPVHEECTIGSAGYTARKPRPSAIRTPPCPECGLMHAGECF